jgi:lysophospholipase L1-like esterase
MITRIALLSLGLLLAALSGECGSRLLMYLKEGRNPYYLTFGFVPDTEFHSAEKAGYTKYAPHQPLHQKIRDETIQVTINGDGFRGLREFERPKPPGRFRIAALGESSTFGYENRDTDTYPFQLESRLREATRLDVEVMNLGIPHFRIQNILALARAELPALQPDLITLYAGYNNSMVVEDRATASGAYRLKDWLYFHSVFYRALHPAVRRAYFELTRLLGQDVGGLPNLSMPVMLRSETVEAQRAKARSEFRENVLQLSDLARELGIPLVLVTQEYSLHRLDANALEGDWPSYPEEVAEVTRRYQADGQLLAPHSSLLIHSDLMDELRKIAAERGLMLVEGIAALDVDRRGSMDSYVHLTAKGNERLAAAIADSTSDTIVRSGVAAQTAVAPAS